MESLARVNDNQDVSSESSRVSEGSRGLQKGDLYVGHFGDKIYVKQTICLRIGFQNVGGLSTQGGKVKDDAVRKGLTT